MDPFLILFFSVQLQTFDSLIFSVLGSIYHYEGTPLFHNRTIMQALSLYCRILARVMFLVVFFNVSLKHLYRLFEINLRSLLLKSLLGHS